MTILKGFYKAEWEHNQECEHNIRELPAIRVGEGFKEEPMLDLTKIDFKKCYDIVKQKTDELYGTKS